MSEELKYFAGIIMAGMTWVGRVIWINHTDLQKVKQDHPTWSDLKDELQQCSDQKDTMIKDLKSDTKYIRDKVDMLINRELDK